MEERAETFWTGLCPGLFVSYFGAGMLIQLEVNKNSHKQSIEANMRITDFEQLGYITGGQSIIFV